MTFASWFTGIGAADIAFELAGYTITGQCEVDRYCNDVLEERWPNVPRHHDITTAPGEYADVYCGGWPCQDLSVAGKRVGLAGARSGLFHELVRVTSEGRPRWLVWENVPGLLSSNGGRDFGTVLGALADIGYFGAWRCLDSRYFGVAQRRRRIFGVFAEGHSGACRAGAVLLEPQGCGWHPATGKGAMQEVARSLDCGAGGISGKEQQRTLVAAALTHDPTAGRNTECDGTLVVANAVSASAGHHGHGSPRGDGADNLVYHPIRSHQRNGDSDGAGNFVASKCLSSRATRYDADTQTFVCPPPDATGVREVAGVTGRVDGLLPVGYDARRYKQTGNAMTVNVLYWIGLRILHVEAMLAGREAVADHD